VAPEVLSSSFIQVVRRRHSWQVLALALSLAGLGACSNVPPSNAKSNARLAPSTGVTLDLSRLPRPKARIPVAVYGFRDQTGQYKQSPDSSYSTLVTQGAASILVKALEDSNWYTPVEREGLQNLLTERRIVRAIESPADKGRPVVNLPNLTPASLIIEGGVTAYESNVRTGGKGANYLGIGSSTQYRVDQVTVSLRSIDVRNGQVLNTVSVTKTIYSHQFSASLYKFTSFQHLLQGETGFTRNEPAQLAVREAIEAAVVHLTVEGVRDRYLELLDPAEWGNPIIQRYLAEQRDNLGREPMDGDALIPMRPLSTERAALVVHTLISPADEAAIQRAMPGSGRTAEVGGTGKAVEAKASTAAPAARPAASAAPSAAPSTVATAVAQAAAPASVPGVMKQTPAPGKVADKAVATKATAPATAPATSPQDKPGIKPAAVPSMTPQAAMASIPTVITPQKIISPQPVQTPARQAPAASATTEAEPPALTGDIFNRYWIKR